MDKITQKAPATDFLGAMIQKAQPRANDGEFKTMLENAVNGRKDQEQKPSVDRPETETPERQVRRKERGQPENAAADAAAVTEAILPTENAQMAQAAAVQQPEGTVQPATAEAAVQAVPAPAIPAAPVPAAIVPEPAQATAASIPVQAPPAELEAEIEIIVEDPAQQKFDSMLQKAAQELEAAKQTEIPAEETVTQAPPEAENEAEQPAPLQAEQQEAPQKQQAEPPRAAVYQAVKTPVMEQRPLEAMPEEDRATLELIGAGTAVPPPAESPEPPEPPAPAIQREINSEPVRMPDQTERIRAEIVQNLAQERTEFTMRLEPESLGKIDVRMILEGGKLAVEITAASLKTAEQLQRQTEQLAASLRLGNVELQNIQVTSSQEIGSHMDGRFGLEGGQNGGAQQQQEGRNAGQGAQSAWQSPGGEPEDETLASPERILDYAI